MTTETAALVVREELTPMAIIADAVERGIDVAQLERLMALQERWEAGIARRAYCAAMALFKATCPPIAYKDAAVSFPGVAGVVAYRHATLGGVIGLVTPHLSAHGLSVSWSVAQTATIEVACRVAHVGGHSESVSMSAPPDDSGKKNRIQGVGSTITYLSRYTLLAALGMATSEDDDAQSAYGLPDDPPPPVRAEKPARQPRAKKAPPAPPAPKEPQYVADEMDILRCAMGDASTIAELKSVGRDCAKLPAGPARDALHDYYVTQLERLRDDHLRSVNGPPTDEP